MKTVSYFRNMHRANRGLPPIIKRNTPAQTEFMNRAKLINYYKERVYDLHGINYFNHPLDKADAEKENSRIGKQIKLFFTRCDKELEKAKEVIDWALTTKEFRFDENDYSPYTIFTARTVVDFEAKKQKRKKTSWN